MDSKPISEEALEFQKQGNPRFYNVYDDSTLKQNLIVGTFQDRPSCLSQSRNLLDSNGSVYEESLGESGFGGSFGHDEADGHVFGGNFRCVAVDDAQVVPDFNDILETIHIDMDKSSIPSASLHVQPEPSTRARQDENCTSKRRNSERDELEIYFPCVLTPIPVDRLYSTLVDDSTVFKFPARSGEFFSVLDGKAGHCLLKQRDSAINSIIPTAEQGQHSLESFGNFSVFSFPYGSQVQFDASGNMLTSETYKEHNASDTCVLTRGKDYNTSHEQNCYQDSGPASDMIEKQITVTAAENNLNFQESLTNSCRSDALNTLENSYGAKVSIQRPPSSQTIYDLPFQFNSAQNSENHVEFPPNLTVDLSVNPVSLQANLTNSFFFHNPVKELVAGTHEFEDGEASFEHGHAEVFNCTEGTPSEFNSSFYSVPDNICKRNSKRTRELSHYSNSNKVKSKETASTDVENSPCLTRTSGKLKSNRKSKSAKTEGAHHGGGDIRDFHNDMEKQRRTNMKTRFQNLRLTVPELLDNGKASKIVILQKAFQYIGTLEQESSELENSKRAERLRNIELLDKLQNITSGKR